MQLLDSVQLSDISESLQLSLQDIIHNVEIQSQYCIKHPNYKPLELPESSVSRFQKLSSDLQNKYLSQQLRSFLYGIYYNGSLKSVLASDAEISNLAVNQNLENNTFLGVDLAFYDRLHENNRGQGYWSYGWQVVREEIDGAIAVYKDGLTLYVEQDGLQAPANLENFISIKLPKNLVQSGFYMAVADAGILRHDQTQDQTLVRVYFNVTPDGAVAVMDSLTTQLNAISLEFTFKALYNPADYERYDSAVLYFNKNDYECVHPILETLYTEHQAHFREQVPLFTKPIAPGLAIAEEPKHRFAENESFGTHRCQIVANGLLSAWLQGINTPSGKMTSILQQFSALNIELQCPYLNADSEDIYTPLR
ncbi:T3SS effector HopA1 family protein [Nostoc sp. UHCC 0870]|uniref:T3SS effector HopA1 family protein n=1 Tax=Nostoc sp. UHCC 0870 TaxID=2914041 RepID=UPI001EE0C39D|nr:T3SS effector HopA1 family protein [Nostoc sp. UHCC 0870]UKP00445.1 T3SS effector HopA1 family protein [Nostoc sp. UHCC 0870]